MGFTARCTRCKDISAKLSQVGGELLCARCLQAAYKPSAAFPESLADQRVQPKPRSQDWGDSSSVNAAEARPGFEVEAKRKAYGMPQPPSGFRPIQESEDHSAPQSYPLAGLPNSSAVSTEDHFILNTFFNKDETLHTEFKACRPQNFDQTWATDMISRYICAFLNTDGGILYYGIRDDHVVRGLQLDAHMRDLLRLGIDNCCNRFQPEVDSDLISVDFQPVYLPNGRTAKDLFVVLVRIKKGLPGVVYFTPFPEPKAWVKRQASVRELKAQSLVAFIAGKLQGRSEEAVPELPRQKEEAKDRRERVMWMYWDAGKGGWVEYPKEVQEVLESRKRLEDVVQLTFRGIPTLFYMSALLETSDTNKTLHIEAKRLDLRPCPNPRWVSSLNTELYDFDSNAVQALERALETGKEEVEVAMLDFTVRVDFERMRVTGDLPLLRMSRE